jgi:hypothetical protein
VFKPSDLVRGFPGHPLHPPLTDATIGGTVVDVHGMRVLNLVEECAVAPGHSDKELAEGGG